MADNWDLNYSPVALEGIKAGVNEVKDSLTSLQATAKFNTDAQTSAVKIGDGVDGNWTKQYFADRTNDLLTAVASFEQWAVSWENAVTGAHATTAEWDEDSKHKIDKLVADREAYIEDHRGAD